MKLKEILKQGKEELLVFEKLEINNKYKFKAFLRTMLIAAFIILPVALIFVSLIKTNSPIMPSYYVIMGLICLFMCLINPVVTIIDIEIVKFMLPNNEELQKIKYKNIFIKELLNPFFMVIVVFIVVVANLLFWGVYNG